MLVRRIQSRRVWSLVCTLALIFSLSSTLTARADELSDAQANLANSQAKLASLQTALSNANAEINNLISKIAATDSTTAEGQSAIASFTTSLDAAKAAKAVIEPQIAPLQSDISALTVKIAALIAAINAANNCPADWGLTSASFVDGLETGVFNYNTKVGSELAKDPRNIVISSSIQFSKDGNSWKTYREISATQWVQYSSLGMTNVGKGAYYSRYVFMSDVYEMLRYSGSQVRVTTTLDKQGCVSHSIVSDVKPLTIASATFAKTSIDDLYAAYPQAFPNYQVRDQAKAAVATVATEFPAAAGSGSQYNFSKGAFNYFQIVTFPRSGGCAGDFNYVTVNIGTSCELGIYWLWNNMYKYIDSVSTVGGSSEAQKQQAAMLTQAKTLQTAAIKIVSNVEVAISQIQSLNSKYSSDWSKAGQIALDQYMAVQQSISDNTNNVSNIRQQMYALLNSNYVNNEIVALVKSTDPYFSKSISGFDSAMSMVRNSIAQIQQYLNSPSSSVKAELDRSTSVKTQAQREVTIANSILNEIGSFSSSSDYAKNYKAYFSKYYPGAQNSFTDANNQYSNIKNWLVSAQQNANSAQSSVDAQSWQIVIANFSAALSLYASVMKVLQKALSILKSPPSNQQGEGAAEFELAQNWVANGEKLIASVEEQFKQYPVILKAKGILLTPGSRDAESASLKAIAEKYLSEVNSIISHRDLAEKRASAGDGEMEDWKNASAYFSKAASYYTAVYKTYMKMLSIVQSGSVVDQTTTATPVFVDLQGEEEGAAGSVTYKKDKQGRYLITVSSNQESTDFVVKAIKAKSKAIIFNATSDADGNIYIRTSRKLAGYVLQLVLDGVVLSKTATLK